MVSRLLEVTVEEVDCRKVHIGWWAPGRDNEGMGAGGGSLP